MVLGMTLSTFTLVHVLISLAGLGSGLIVVLGMIAGKRLDGWTAVFLVTTVLTSATGFLFPVEHLLPSHIVGIISLVVLAVAIVARYAPSHGGGVAHHLCSERRAGSVFEFVRRGSAVFSEDSVRARAGAYTKGAAIPGCATSRDGDLHRARSLRCKGISRGADRGRLIGRIRYS